ncbi:MAG: DNA-directed RNA polymerase [Candidatus Anstonellales archaeon]
MYNIVTLKEKFRVPPELFRMDRDEAIKEVIKNEYENKIRKELGYIISVIDVKSNDTGLVAPGDPNVYYEAEYSLLTFSLEPNEVLCGVVKDVIDFGAFVTIGPFEALLHVSQISKEKFSFNKKTKQLVSSDGTKTIKKGDIIYAKVSSVSMKDLSNVKISLTSRDLGLGKLEWLKQQEKEAKKKETKGAKKK